MIAVEVALLTGRYVATAHDNRDGSEWPPHPARLFSALVAEWGPAPEPDDAERDVLQQIERWGAPSIVASDAFERSPVIHYVPVNDANVTGEALWRRVRQAEEAAHVLGDAGATEKQRTSAAKRLAAARDVSDLTGVGARTGSSTLPQDRGKQARTFPSVTPIEPIVTYVWPAANLDDRQVTVFDGLLERVSRLGHSSSLVSCRVVADPPPPNWIPDADGKLAIRGVEPGQLLALRGLFEQHRGSKPRSLPSTTIRYSVPGKVEAPAPVAETAGEWYTLEFEDGRRLPASRVVQITAALRGALMANADTVSVVLHGHERDGSPTRLPHVSCLALPDVAHRHASGRVLGIAVMLPRDADRSQRREVLRAVGTWIHGGGAGGLLLQGGQRVQVGLVDEPSLVALQRQTWSALAREWVSATPIALPWHAPKSNRGAREWELAESWISDSCRHIGLPEPASVELTVAPLLQGALPANRYPAFRQGGIARRLVHARVVFADPIAGPIVLGSGRYFGLGLMRPVREAR